MPDCPVCDVPLLAAEKDGWWVCPNDEDTAHGVYAPDAPLTDDPRNPQITLDDA